MKKIFTMAALMLAAGSAYAGSFDDCVAFTYAPGPQDDWMGCFAPARYNAGIQLFGDQFPGYKVVGFQATDLNHCTGMDTFTGWVSTKLSGENEEFVPDVELIEVPDGPVDGVMTVEFSEPVEIPAEGLYVGYGMEVIDLSEDNLNDDNIVPVPMCMGTSSPGTSWVQVIMDGWSGWADYSDYPGCAICMTVYLKGEVQDNYLTLSSVDGHMAVMKGNPFTLPFTVANSGGNAIESLTYTYKVGDKSFEKELELAEPIAPVLGATSRIELSFDAVDAQGAYDFEVSIPKVNGNDNISPRQTIQSRLSVVDYEPRHLPLMEEATGTWCGNCPRGWLGMREMGNALGEDFIGVAYHSGDPMQVTEVYPWEVSGYPEAVIDRGKGIDPFWGSYGYDVDLGIMGDWQEAAARVAVAEISATSSWADDSKTVMNVEASVKFALDDNAADYKVGYVLIGNGYCHPDDKAWAQHNYYAGEQYEGMLAELAELPASIKDMVYNHVAIDTEAMLGVAKSLPSSVKLGEVYGHSYWFETAEILGMDGDNLIENPQYLEVVAFVVDGAGKVVNACRTMPEGNSVDLVSSESGETEYFDLMGRRVSNPGHGIYIKRCGGVARKVMR